MQRAELVGHPLGLVGLVLALEPHDLIPATGVGPELLGLAVRIVGDHRVGGIEDRLGGAVVLLQHHHGGVGEGVLELQDVADVGRPEGIDRVVHQHVVGHIGVRRVDLQVEHRAAVVHELHTVDAAGFELAVTAVHEHLHAPAEVRQRREVVCVARHHHPAPQVQATHVCHGSGQAQRLGVVHP